MTNYTTLLKLARRSDTESLAKLEKALIENIREEEAKKNGCKISDLTIIKRLLKVASHNPTLNGFFKMEHENKDYFSFCNGYMILGSKNDFSYDKAPGSLDLNKIFVLPKKQIKIEVDKKDLRAFIKIRESDDQPYILEKSDYRIAANPKCLLDLLNFNGSVEIICNKESNKAPFFCFGDEKLGLLLPVRCNEV